MRFLSRFVTKSVIYTLLIAGSIVFAFPFLWMATTSVKVDRELFTEKITIMPMAPRPRMKSPYIDDRYYPAPAGPRAAELSSVIHELVRKAKPDYPAEFSREAAEEAVVRGLFKRLSLRLPADVWEAPRDEFARQAAKEIDRAIITETLDGARRELAFGLLLARDRQLVEQRLGGDTPVGERMVNLTPGVARMTDGVVNGQSMAVVHYDFNRGDTARWQKTFTTTFDSGDLQRVQLYLRPDDTWHELRLTVEAKGKRYRAERPVFLANMSWATVTWQVRRGGEQPRLKTWLWLEPVKNASSEITDPHLLRLTFELRHVSGARAWFNKLRNNYILVTEQIPFLRYLRVSAFLVLANIVLVVLASSLVAYAFARLKWPGRDFAFYLMLATMMIPAQVTMIPHFLIWKSLGGYNTLTPLWLGAAFGNAFFIFLLRQTLKGIPRDLEDAARLDGCGVLRIYWHIMLPFAKPSLAAIAIFTFMGVWNDFMGPLIYIADQKLYPLAFGLYAYSVTISSNPALTMAASLLVTLPVILVFFFAQKYFIQGIAMTGMK